MQWIDVADELPICTNIVFLLTDYLEPYFGYLGLDGLWYVNCPCCEKCEIFDVRYWSDWDALD
jgi:hypothetical protein